MSAISALLDSSWLLTELAKLVHLLALDACLAPFVSVVIMVIIWTLLTVNV